MKTEVEQRDDNESNNYTFSNDCFWLFLNIIILFSIFELHIFLRLLLKFNLYNNFI